MYRSDCTNCVASYSRCGPRRPSCSCGPSLENLVLQALKDLFFARKYWNKSVVHLAIPKEAWFARRIIRLIDHPSRGRGVSGLAVRIGRPPAGAQGMAGWRRARPFRSEVARHRQVSGVASLSARPTRARPRHRPGYPRSRPTRTARHRRVARAPAGRRFTVSNSEPAAAAGT